MPAMNKLYCLVSLVGFALAVAAAPMLPGQSAHKDRQPASVPEYSYRVIHSYPHDPRAFTQGLVYLNGFLYESTGQYGQSSLRKVGLETGEVLQQVDLPPECFGEGIAILDDEIIQLTWQSQKGFIYNLKDFHLLREFSYIGEGWGLAAYGRDLLMSDGSADIRVLDGRTLLEKRHIKVREGKVPVPQLNELEMVEDEIFANVWQTDRVARISPQSGQVLGWIDLKGLLGPMYRPQIDAVLNGIAYDPGRKRLFVTGKLWPRLFEIQLVPKPGRGEH